jgi:CRP/FNR family cyclic AMP-dependent transcriptional regulator
MSGTEYLEHLATIPLFSSCNRRELGKIAKATDELTVGAGKVLTEEGSVGREAFVIVSGEVAVEIGGVEVARLGPGDHFGELALLDGGPRTATVTAATDVDLLVISQRSFFSLLDDVPGLARKILTSMATVIRGLDARLPMAH